MSLLEVTGLTKRFYPPRRMLRRRGPPVDAVEDVSFTVDAGQTLALVGESGAGKSTTGRLVIRLVEPDAGSVVFDGTNVLELGRSQLRSMRQRMQIIFQDPHTFDPRIAVGDSVAEPLLVHFGMPRDERTRRAAELLERVGLSSRELRSYPRELSGGQLQRAAIARALTLNPRLLICDEPVSALDVSVQAQVLNLMRDLQESFGLAYLFIAHDLALVEVIADRVAVMVGGRIVEQGSAADVYGNPSSPYTRELLASIPVPIPRRSRRARTSGVLPEVRESAHPRADDRRGAAP